MSGAQAMSIGGYNWAAYLKNDYAPSAFKYLPNQTLTQCAQACATTSGCKGFATGVAVSPTVAGDCSLKNAWTPSGLTPNTNLNAYQYLPPGTSPAPSLPPAVVPVVNSTGSVYSTFPNKDCYNASYDRGYQGVKSQAAIQAICDANPKCDGAVQHSGGDWWILEKVTAPATNSPGSMCIQKGKEAIPPYPMSSAPAPMSFAPAPMGSAAALAHSPVHTAPKYERVTPKQTEHCLETLRKCVAAAPDSGSPAPAHSPSSGTSHYQAYGGAPFGEPASTGSNIMKIFLAFLVVMFAMLMAAKQ